MLSIIHVHSCWLVESALTQDIFLHPSDISLFNRCWGLLQANLVLQPASHPWHQGEQVEVGWSFVTTPFLIIRSWRPLSYYSYVGCYLWWFIGLGSAQRQYIRHLCQILGSLEGDGVSTKLCSLPRLFASHWFISCRRCEENRSWNIRHHSDRV